MARQTEVLKTEMELTGIPGTSLELSRVAIGTRAIGGWMWGGTDEAPAKAEIDRILIATISEPIGPEFMAPRARSYAAA